MTKCANPECPEATYAGNHGLRDRWVQVEETDVVNRDTAGTESKRRTFAAVTCSKRCAVIVLMSQLSPEDADCIRRGEPFPDPWSAIASGGQQL